MELSGRTALITGAAVRVGRAIALRLAQAGMDVAVHYHRSRAQAEQTAADCRAAGVRAEALAGDLADAAVCAKLVATVLGTMGRLDALINNASIFEEQRLETFELAAWERTLRVNLTAPMILAHAARAALRTAGGRIINLGDAACERPWTRHLAYCVSKGGLHTLTKALARALAPEVNVVALAPGVADWPEHYDEATRARLIEKIPLRRAGTPADIAEAVHFLLAQGDYITGVILPIDGGRGVST